MSVRPIGEIREALETLEDGWSAGPGDVLSAALDELAYLRQLYELYSKLRQEYAAKCGQESAKEAMSDRIFEALLKRDKEVRTLRERFADHMPSCPGYVNGRGCTCGLAELNPSPDSISALRAQVRTLREALEDANDKCRSAYQVAARGGVDTNWPALTTQLGKSLKSQLAALALSPTEGPREDFEREEPKLCRRCAEAGCCPHYTEKTPEGLTGIFKCPCPVCTPNAKDGGG